MTSLDIAYKSMSIDIPSNIFIRSNQIDDNNLQKNNFYILFYSNDNIKFIN